MTDQAALREQIAREIHRLRVHYGGVCSPSTDLSSRDFGCDVSQTDFAYADNILALPSLQALREENAALSEELQSMRDVSAEVNRLRGILADPTVMCPSCGAIYEAGRYLYHPERRA